MKDRSENGMQTLNMPNLQEAASQFDRRAISGVREEAEKLRLELLHRFPISGWPTMLLKTSIRTARQRKLILPLDGVSYQNAREYPWRFLR